MNTFLLNFYKYFPLVLNGVIAIQQSAASQLPGANKKQIFMGAVIAAAKVGEEIPEAHVAGISTMIDNVVTSLNDTNQLGFGNSGATPKTIPTGA